MSEETSLPPSSSCINMDTELTDNSQHFEDRNELIKEKVSSSATGIRHFGNNFVFCFRNNEPLITIGPHWFLFIPTFLCFFIISIYIIFHAKSTTSSILQLFISIFHLFFYSMVGLKNPGISSTALDFDEESFVKEKRCRVCKVKRSQYVVHCPDCDICVRGFDHHCPWVGKCVGEGNLAAFYGFILSTVIWFSFSLVIFVGIF